MIIMSSSCDIKESECETIEECHRLIEAIKKENAILSAYILTLMKDKRDFSISKDNIKDKVGNVYCHVVQSGEKYKITVEKYPSTFNNI